MPTDNQGPVYPGTQPTQQVPPEPPTQTYYQQSSAQQAAGQVPPTQTTQAYAQPATGQAYAQQAATGQAYAQQAATGQVPPTQVPPIPGAGAGAGAPKPKKPHVGIKVLVFGLIGGILGAAGVVAALNFGGFFDERRRGRRFWRRPRCGWQYPYQLSCHRGRTDHLGFRWWQIV